MSRIQTLRSEYHRRLCATVLGLRDGIPSNADRSSKVSRDIAERLLRLLPYPLCVPPPEQTIGTLFEKTTATFLQEAFHLLSSIRPGRWGFFVAETSRPINRFEQYEHLNFLSRALAEHPELSAILGSDYIIKPDIVIGRYPLEDQELNASHDLVDENEEIVRHTPLRRRNRPAGSLILHASISCKWTIRSDRAQSIRTEALNLIRNRKGHTPHIVAVTAEPLPTRIASLALGTGEVDCVYHFALCELVSAVEESENESQKEMLDMLIEGRRLRDISDLPFDLAV